MLSSYILNIIYRNEYIETMLICVHSRFFPHCTVQCTVYCLFHYNTVHVQNTV